MTNYYICPICTNPIEVEKYEEHRKTHGKTNDETDTSKLKQILDESKKSWKKINDNNPISLFFEIARRVISEIEKVDTSSWRYVFDYEIPNLMTTIEPRVPSPYPPIMCHIYEIKVKDKETLEQLIKEHRITKKEQMVLTMVLTNKPIIVVYGREWSGQCLQWKSEGKSSTDTMMLTAYFFVHEMYHILGFGEKDSTIKGSMAMYRIFGQNLGIPEHEIERWKYEEKLKKQETES